LLARGIAFFGEKISRTSLLVRGHCFHSRKYQGHRSLQWGIASIPNKNSMASLLAMQVEKHYYIRKNGSGL
jgi:hypothetical protein